MGSCDKPCDAGHIWDGDAGGRESTLGGLDAYLADPPSTANKAIVVVPDIYGWKLNNVRLWADKIAAEGFFVVVPDTFHGNPWVPGDQLGTGKWDAWRQRHAFDSQEKDVLAVVEDLKQRHGISSVGVVGFCWGGLFAGLLAGHQGCVAASVIIHGSFLTEKVVEDLLVPTLFLCAENDSVMPADMRQKIEGILASKSFATGLKTYPGTHHGFAVRGDLSKKLIAEGAADAVKQTVAFLKLHV